MKEMPSNMRTITFPTRTGQRSGPAPPKKKVVPFVVDGHEYILVRDPECNKTLPWLVYFYQMPDGTPRGNTGMCYPSLKAAKEAAREFHRFPPRHGWLSPEGKFYRVVYEQHTVIVDLFCPEANGDYMALLRKGWMVMRHGKFPEDMHWDLEVTRAQYRWIEEWCASTKQEMPEFCQPGWKR